MIKKYFYLIGLVIGLTIAATGCGGSEDINDHRALAFEEVDTIAWEELPVNDIVPHSWNILVSDSLIYNLSIMDGNYLNLYDKNTGKHIAGKLRAGQGPGEIVQAITMNMVSDSVLSVYDHMASRLINYDIKTFESKGVYELHKNHPVVNSAWGLPGGLYLVQYPFKQSDKQEDFMRAYSIVDAGENKIIDTYDGIEEPFQNEPRLLANNQEQFAISPDGTHFAVTGLWGGTMEFFSLADRKITPIFSARLFPLNYDKNDGGELPQFDPVIGFISVTATNDRVYAAFLGCKESEVNNIKIGVWDWNGNPIKEIVTDKVFPQALTIDETQNALYCIPSNLDSDPQILRLPL